MVYRAMADHGRPDASPMERLTKLVMSSKCYSCKTRPARFAVCRGKEGSTPKRVLLCPTCHEAAEARRRKLLAMRAAVAQL